MSEHGDERDPLLADLIGGLEAPAPEPSFLDSLMARVRDTPQEGVRPGVTLAPSRQPGVAPNRTAPVDKAPGEETGLFRRGPWMRIRQRGTSTDRDKATSPARTLPRVSSRAAVETRYSSLAAAFSAIGWRIWSDIDIDPGMHPVIGELGRVRVLDLSPEGPTRGRSDLFFGVHSDFPDLPLVVKCAKRGVIQKSRPPSYWQASAEVPPDVPLSSAEALRFETFAYHLANEIAFAEEVKGLPHIVPPVASGHAGMIGGRWHAYVVYPYFPKGDLEEFLRGPNATEEAFEGPSLPRMLSHAEFQQVGRSLHAALTGLWLTAQQRHRDIKLGNLLVDGSGAVWLTDFEIASPQGAITTRDRKTPEFCAPEVLDPRAAPANRYLRAMAAEAYSVGAVLYTLAAGAFPHWSEARKHGPEQRVEDWELAVARASGPPPVPIGMGSEAWTQLATLLSPDPYERVGLDEAGWQRLVELAALRAPLGVMGPEEVLRRVEESDPDLLQRTLALHCLETVSLFLEADRTSCSWSGTGGSDGLTAAGCSSGP